MTNQNSPNGFSFVRNSQSASPTYQRTVRQIAYGNTNSFGKGDVVKTLSTGYIDRALTTDTQVLGILDGCEYYDTFLQKKVYSNAWLAPTTALANSVIAYVIDDPQAVFAVQSGNGGPVTYGSVGNNINFKGNAAPNTSTGISVAYADFTTIATTNTLPFRIVDVPQTLNGIPTSACIINNDSTSANNIIYVKLNACDATALTGI